MSILACVSDKLEGFVSGNHTEKSVSSKILISSSGSAIIYACTRFSKNRCDNQNCDVMPLFMVKKKYFDLLRFGKRDVELRAVKRQWKNSKIGDIATIQCGRQLLRKRIINVHRGTLARIFLKVDYKQAFPEASTVFQAVKAAIELYPDAEEFMAFELEDIV